MTKKKKKNNHSPQSEKKREVEHSLHVGYRIGALVLVIVLAFSMIFMYSF